MGYLGHTHYVQYTSLFSPVMSVFQITAHTVHHMSSQTISFFTVASPNTLNIRRMLLNAEVKACNWGVMALQTADWSPAPQIQTDRYSADRQQSCSVLGGVCQGCTHTHPGLLHWQSCS